MPPNPDPYGRTEFRDRPLDFATAAACVDMEVRLGYRLTIMQGIGGNPSSAGTHLGKLNAAGTKMEGGRAVDLAPYDASRKCHAGRDVGFAMWARELLPGEWPEHEHGALIFGFRGNDRGIAPAAFRQIASYDALKDGLAGNGPDPDRYRPKPAVAFTLDRYRYVMTEYGLNGGPLPTRITKIRDALVQEDYDIGLIVSLLKAEPQSDQNDRFVKKLQKDRTEIRSMLERMPKR